MQTPKLLELLPEHASLWNHFQTINAKQRLPHAILLIGPQHADMTNFSSRMSAAILCSHEKKPCGECKSCRLVISKEHPDWYCLQPDSPSGIIKIDQIRDLQAIIFTSPQLNGMRVVTINPAEKMNVAAANALLKLLEEPPSCVIFILIAEQISTLPPTILSRCQQWRVAFTDILEADYLTIGEEYANQSERGKLFEQLMVILQDLSELISNKMSVCALAAKWSVFEFHHLLWIIYLVNAQMINYQLTGSHFEKKWTKQLYELSSHFQPTALFRQLDEINAIIRKLNQNINMNQTLVLENLLLGYSRLTCA